MKDRKKEKINDKLNKQRYKCPNCGWESDENQLDDPWDHCPNCLYSVHLDNRPGDRASSCHGRMEPIGVWVRKSGEWAVIHRCKSCGKIHANRVAADDNPMKLMALAIRPFGTPAISQTDIKNMVASMER